MHAPPSSLPALPEGWVYPDADASERLHAELQRELPPGHRLLHVPVATFASRDGSDDVLFRHVDEPDRFTVVHLTWAGRTEINATHPAVEFEGSFRDFVAHEERLYGLTPHADPPGVGDNPAALHRLAMTPDSARIDHARTLLGTHGDLRSQPASDWTGEIPLPDEVAAFYDEIGPDDLTVEGYGNPYFFPRLSRLWDFQAGYRWNGVSGERIDDWDDDWLVVADEGGNPFIFDRASGRVLFDEHGRGVWEPEEWFPDLVTMAAVLAAMGGVVRDAGEALTDEDFAVRPEHVERAVASVAEIVGSRERAERLVSGFGWR